MSSACPHVAAVTAVKHPSHGRVCEACVKMGAQWVHLRTCQTCGVKHPVIASAEPGERWLYCYVDDTFAEY